ncbi:MAG: S8 family serine peptidase [Deltaproteobacteria bacterium]|nr:S8 family serine peptidase [Deltaproteobacteria bacterium]
MARMPSFVKKGGTLLSTLPLLVVLGCAGDPSEHPTVVALKSEFALQRVEKPFADPSESSAKLSAKPALTEPKGAVPLLPSGQEDFVAGELLVKYRGVKVEEGFELLRSRNPHFDLKGAIEKFKENPYVEYVQPNYLHKITSLPNDPILDKQWYLRNTGQEYLYEDGFTVQKKRAKRGADIKAEKAWEFFNAYHDGKSEAVIALIDTGVDFDHEDLAGRFWINEKETGVDESGADRRSNGIDDDGNGYVDDWRGWNFYSDSLEAENDPSDVHGHGTHLAGIVAAVSDNGTGVAGVGRGTKVMALRASSSKGELTLADVLDAIRYAVENGADIISMSFSMTKYSEIEHLAVKYAAEQGVVTVAAAGNDGADIVHYPAGYEEVIAVQASDQRDERWKLSNYGSHIDIAAPGVAIYSTLPARSYDAWSGTSMATPIVSAVLGTMKALYPTLTAEELKERLLSTADDVDWKSPKHALKLGARRVNYYRALAEW